MPKKDPGPSVRDKKLYEKLRDEGNSKQKAARIANAAAGSSRKKVSKKGGRSPSYDDWTLTKLRRKAKQIGVRGRSTMSKKRVTSARRSTQVLAWRTEIGCAHGCRDGSSGADRPRVVATTAGELDTLASRSRSRTANSGSPASPARSTSATTYNCCGPTNSNRSSGTKNPVVSASSEATFGYTRDTLHYPVSI